MQKDIINCCAYDKVIQEFHMHFSCRADFFSEGIPGALSTSKIYMKWNIGGSGVLLNNIRCFCVCVHAKCWAWKSMPCHVANACNAKEGLYLCGC